AAPSADELVAQAVERRPDLRLLGLAANRAEAERALASASAWEDWNVSLGVTRDRLAIEGLPRQPSDDTLTMALTIPLPLLNRNEGTRDAAAADKIVAQEELVALHQRIENEVVGSREQLTQLVTAVDVYEKEALPLARKNSALARDAYRKGQIAISDVVQAERQEKDVATTYTDALAKYFKGIVALETATVEHADLMTHPVENDATQTKEQ
ncbi:MAG: TolC family protein, partial [Micropepsaceae bacterium]